MAKVLFVKMTATVTPPPVPLVGNYFVAAYPPFSCWQPKHIPEVRAALRQGAANSPIGFYVHIPFCAKKCDYCYYLSYTGARSDIINDYVDSVVNEAALYSKTPAVQGRDVSFVYFGGGTPSMLSAAQIASLAKGLKFFLPWKNVREVTFECAPRSVRPTFLQALHEIGVTRLSMGVQSFDDDLLKLNGRMHLAEDVLHAYELIQDADFGWVNLDLMTGLLGETAEHWKYSVKRVTELGPDSVTIYQTEIPYNTQLYRDVKSSRLPAPLVPWEAKRERLDYAFQKLTEAGYTIVNGYSAVKDPKRHNFIYQDHLWRGGDMIGMGVASFSYFAGVHYQNTVTLDSYKSLVRQGQLPFERAFALSEHDKLVREFILQLKCGEVSVERFRNRFSFDLTQLFAHELGELASEGLLTFSESSVHLTRAGLLRVDGLSPRFYEAAYRDVRYT